MIVCILLASPFTQITHSDLNLAVFTWYLRDHFFQTLKEELYDLSINDGNSSWKGKITKGKGIFGQRYHSQMEVSFPELVGGFKVNFHCHL